jgi:hypothetical protein
MMEWGREKNKTNQSDYYCYLQSFVAIVRDKVEVSMARSAEGERGMKEREEITAAV